MKTITGKFLLPDGTPAAGGKLQFTLSASAMDATLGIIAPKVVTVTLDAAGSIPANTQLFANDELTPATTSYSVKVTGTDLSVLYGPESLTISGVSPINMNALVPVQKPVRGKLCPHK